MKNPDPKIGKNGNFANFHLFLGSGFGAYAAQVKIPKIIRSEMPRFW